MAIRSPAAGRLGDTIGSHVSSADVESIKRQVDIIWHTTGLTIDAKLDRLSSYRNQIDQAYAQSVAAAVAALKDPEPVQQAYLLTICYFLWIICNREEEALVRNDSTIRRAVRDALNEDFVRSPTESLRGKLLDLEARLRSTPAIFHPGDVVYIKYVQTTAEARDEDFQRR